MKDIKLEVQSELKLEEKKPILLEIYKKIDLELKNTNINKDIISDKKEEKRREEKNYKRGRAAK